MSVETALDPLVERSEPELEEQEPVVVPDAAAELRRQRVELLDGVREERRFHATNLEMRETTDGMLRFSGYASVTERAYEVGDFTETIARGAFKRSLSENPDLVLTINHGEGGRLPLARTKSGTMRLSEDARGLRVDADLNPNDPDVKSLIPKLERGDVDEMSFAFRVTDQEWSEDRSQRLIRSVALNKGDCSIVTYGANDATVGGLVTTVRSDDGQFEFRAGKTLSAANEATLKEVLNQMSSADDALDKAQPLLAGVLGVSNPDADDEASEPADGSGMGSMGRAAEPEVEVKVISIPDLTTRAEQRVALLRRTGR